MAKPRTVDGRAALLAVRRLLFVLSEPALPGIDQSRQFIPLKIAVLTVSDTRELADDKSGATLAERIEKAGHAVADRKIVTDDVENIRAAVKRWIADPAVD